MARCWNVSRSSKTAGVPAKEATKNWRSEGKKRKITEKEYRRLLNEFELELSMAQKGLWNLAGERNFCRTEVHCPGKKVM